MVVKNRLVGDDLAVSFWPVHVIECCAASYDAYRVTREPHSVKRVYEKVLGEVSVSSQCRETMRLPLGIKDLAVANAFDGCLDKVERAFGALEKIAYGRLKLDPPDSALGDI